MIKLSYDSKTDKTHIEVIGELSDVVSELGVLVLNFFDAIDDELKRAKIFTAWNLSLTDNFFNRLKNSPDESLKTKTKPGV